MSAGSPIRRCPFSSSATTNIILCQRKEPLIRTVEQDGRLHHAFDVGTEMFNEACKLFHRLGIKIHEPAISTTLISPAAACPSPPGWKR